MKLFIYVGIAISVLALSACGKSTTALETELSAARQETKDLQVRVDALEGRLQALEASLPDPEPDPVPASAPSGQ